MKMFSEFKQFAFKGNLIDMAVGIIIGGAFATVVKSLVDNVFMPPLGNLLAGVDFSKLKWVIQEEVTAVAGPDGAVTTAAVPEVAVRYGQFFQDFISFLLLALVVFIVIHKVVGAMKKDEVVEAPSEPPREQVLLAEIRDILKDGK